AAPASPAGSAPPTWYSRCRRPAARRRPSPPPTRLPAGVPGWSPSAHRVPSWRRSPTGPGRRSSRYPGARRPGPAGGRSRCRCADTLSANARYPAVAGALGEAGRGRVGLLDGVYGGLTEADRDIFADPVDEQDEEAMTRLRLVLLRDGGLADDDEVDEGEPQA